MSDVEKAVKGLKYLHDVKRWSPDESEESITARRNITGDAIALLKEQEPRVMAGAELTDAELIEEIRKAPIVLKPNVDAAPVVRCAYCKHCFDIGSDPMEPYDGESEWYCERFDRDTSAYEIDPYRFFCADGERRDKDAFD